MARLALVLTPNPILKMKSAPVESVDKNLQSFLDDMLETMYHEEGAGLAAVQVGVLKRIFVVDIGKKSDEELKNPHFFIILHNRQTVFWIIKFRCYSFFF